MSTTYKLKMKYQNGDGTKTRSLTVNDADPNITKQTVNTWGTVSAFGFSDTNVLASAYLVSTTETDLLTD